jgi:hypothetical protein
MSSSARQERSQTVDGHEDASFRALEARLLGGAAQRIHVDVERAKRLGLIDNEGRRSATELPEEMIGRLNESFVQCFAFGLLLLAR